MSSPAPGKILIVDDDEGLRRLISRSLEREGFLTATAASGREAGEWLRHNLPELMLLDLKLPDYQGAELVDHLASIRSEVPFVIITGQGDERAAVEMMKRGALDYIVKDVQFLEFVPALVRRTLGQVEREKRLAEAEVARKRLERELLEVSEREQRRIGHDLHDGLGQTLAGVDVLLEVLKKRLAANAPADADAVAAISNYVKDAIQQTRMLAQGLSPVQVETNGLMSALKGLADHATRLFKVSCSFHCDEPVAVTDVSKATHLYRIAQEAINNAVRHGKARRIEIGLVENGTSNKLTISSDGTPPPTEDRPKDGMGLHTMKYRADVIGGKVEIAPGRNSGSEVICTFPKG